MPGSTYQEHKVRRQLVEAFKKAVKAVASYKSFSQFK